jgi:predicted Kef-type K+ transport protein
VALGLALVLGCLAARLKLPVLVGYLLGGILIGPYTLGFVADTEIAGQLAEIGVMLLMFGVGLHFSLDDLLKVRKIALPGAVLQIAVATAPQRNLYRFGTRSPCCSSSRWGCCSTRWSWSSTRCKSWRWLASS